MPFNIPNELVSQEVYTGCPPGYVLVGDACVNSITGSIYYSSESSEYEFEYYEIGGELIGRYKLSVRGDQDAPALYFSQNVGLDRFENLEIDEPSQIMNDKESMLYLNVSHSDNLGNPEVEIITALESDSPDYDNTFLFGEFFLLPNNISAISRINLNYDMAQGSKVFANWEHKINNPELPNFTQEEIQPLVDWYLGYSRIPTRDRPEEMMVDSGGLPATPSIQNKIYGTDRLKWKTLRDTCFKWMRIYDKMSLNEYFSDDIPSDGQYILQIKGVVNKDRLQTFLNNNVDSSSYPDSSMDYRLIFYPPSFYMYPADTINKIISPNTNATNNVIDEIIFSAANNYKTDGNIHYMIEFLTAKNSGDILFRTSSYDGHDYSEGFQWQVSSDLENWSPMTTELPDFMNSFNENNGSDSEQTKYIKYILSDNAKIKTDNLANVLFRVKQLDGTLIA